MTSVVRQSNSGIMVRIASIVISSILTLSCLGDEPIGNGVLKEKESLRALFESDKPRSDVHLAAIRDQQDIIVELLVQEDAAWLAESMADAVRLSPFGESRRESFEALIAIATRVLHEPGAKTAPGTVLQMPARSIFLAGTEYRVIPSYGAKEIEGILAEFQIDPRSEVRLAVATIAQRLGVAVRERVAACQSIVQKQVEMEVALCEAEGVGQAVVDDRTRQYRYALDDFESILHQGWEPGTIADTEFRTLLVASRKDLLAYACDGYGVALSLLLKTPPNFEEREALFRAASRFQAVNSSKSELILSYLCYQLQPEIPREEELMRIDEAIAWFEKELDLTLLTRMSRISYIQSLHNLAGRPSRNDPLNSPAYLDRERGRAIIVLMEKFLVYPDVGELTKGKLEILRRIYEGQTPEHKESVPKEGQCKNQAK